MTLYSAKRKHSDTTRGRLLAIKRLTGVYSLYGGNGWRTDRLGVICG